MTIKREIMDQQQRKRLLEAARQSAKQTAKLAQKYDGLSSLVGMRGAIYARVSTRYQEANGSLGEQTERCRTFATECNVTIPDELIEQEVFDGESLARPQLQNLERAAKEGRFDLLIADKVDRFSRADLYATGWFKHQLRRYGVRIICLDTPDESDTGLMLQTILQAYAHQEKKRITERTQSGRKRRVRGEGRSGQPALMVGASPKYGYRYAEGEEEKGKRYRYILDEEVARWVAWIFNEYARGMALAHIRRHLDELGVPTPNAYFVSKGWPTPQKKVATHWALSTLDRMLGDPAYAGRHSAYQVQEFKQEVEEDGYRVLVKWREKRDKDHPDRIFYSKDVCPPIIDEETWEKVQERRRRNKAEAARNMDREKAGLLRAGFILCGYCGHRMITTNAITKRHVVRRYTCRTHIYYRKGLRDDDCPSGGFVSIHQEPLDRAVWTHLTRMLTDPSVVQDTYDELTGRETVNEELHSDRLSAIEESIRKAEKRRTRAERYALAADDDEEADRYNAEAKACAKDIRTLETEREQLARLHATRSNRARIFADLIARKNDTAARLLQMTTEERRDLLYDLGVRVRVFRQGHGEEDGTPVWWAIDADAARIAAYFNTLPGYDKRRRENKTRSDSGASASESNYSPSTPNHQNSGKPCSSRTSGPAPAAT